MLIEEQIASLLPQLGLTEYELKVYAASVEVGRATANRLARKTGIPRTSVYSALERLQKKGLVALEQQTNVQAYLPASTHTLVALAEERVREAQMGLKTAKQVSEMLESARGRDAISSSKVLIVEGKTAVRAKLQEWAEAWRNSVVATNRPWSGFQDESFLKHYGDTTVAYWKRFKSSKFEAQNVLRLFQEDGEVSRYVDAQVGKIAGERRKLKPLPGVGRFTATLWIVGEFVIVLKTQSDPHYLLQIRDGDLAENIFAVFEILWEITPKVS